MGGMGTKVLAVLPAKEARDGLSKALRRFREEGSAASPLVFGVHRKPEGVVISFELYEELLSTIDDALIVEEISPRLAQPAEDVGWEEGLAKLGVDPSIFE
jgi:antitoxin StbD